jgi:hypothetical protein
MSGRHTLILGRKVPSVSSGFDLSLLSFEIGQNIKGGFALFVYLDFLETHSNITWKHNVKGNDDCINGSGAVYLVLPSRTTSIRTIII